MSTPEQPATPALTRKQLRDLRNTGSNPIIPTDSELTGENPIVEPSGAETTPEAETPAPPPHAAAPLPRAAVPVPVHDLPGADSSVDLGVSPLTRRQARQQERIRTASVPVITPEVIAAQVVPSETVADGSDSAEVVIDEAPREEFLIEAAPDIEVSDPDPIDEVPAAAEDDGHADAAETAADAEADPAESDEEHERAVVNPAFGAELLAGEGTVTEVPASFDQLITRSVTGGVSTGSALILTDTPASSPLVAPVTATGEVLITGSFNLPEGLGSTGHAPGTADGKEVDAVLVDGELPAHSSPTPIAASAAISTVKNNGDIITPPAPEKGSRLMLTLAITAGVLALALVGVLILAFVTGVF